jgi:TPR repeat protein
MARKDELTGMNDNGIPPRTKALMVLVAVVTLIAVWLVPSDEQEAPPALPEMASPPPADQPLALPQPAADAGEDTADQREGNTARTIITELRGDNTEPDVGAVFAQAEQLHSEGQVDDAYLLYRFAARRGHAQAALALGAQADPAFYTAEASILPGPDLQQAYKWYGVAAAAGSEEAVARQQRLRERVEQSAADGDQAARRLMLQWQ